MKTIVAQFKTIMILVCFMVLGFSSITLAANEAQNKPSEKNSESSSETNVQYYDEIGTAFYDALEEIEEAEEDGIELTPAQQVFKDAFDDCMEEAGSDGSVTNREERRCFRIGRIAKRRFGRGASFTEEGMLPDIFGGGNNGDSEI